MPITLEERGEGRPLALVHGVGTSRDVWRHVIEPLAADARVLAPDLPGFGDSPALGPGFELEAIADGLASALRDRVAEPYDLVGHSLGGAISVVLASRNPEDIRRLVLVAPAGFAPRSWAVATAL